MTLTGAEADARDLTQQTFYVWATKGRQLRDLSKVKTWLFTTLNRVFLTGQKRRVRFPHHNLEDVLQELPAPSPELIDQTDYSQVMPALAKVDEVYQELWRSTTWKTILTKTSLSFSVSRSAPSNHASPEALLNSETFFTDSNSDFAGG
jgi:hypothetical protein